MLGHEDDDLGVDSPFVSELGAYRVCGPMMRLSFISNGAKSTLDQLSGYSTPLVRPQVYKNQTFAAGLSFNSLETLPADNVT